MRDVLAHCGVDVDAMALGKIDPHSIGIKHVQFEGYDATETGITYGGSVPIDKVIDPLGDCLCAYEMNGVPLPPDHGKPVRAMIPGYAGCRSCKWLNKITLSSEMSTKPWQNKSYLHFPPDCQFEGDPDKTPGKALWKWTKDPPLKKYLEDKEAFRFGHMSNIVAYIQPTTSIICSPPQAQVIAGTPDFVEVKGVAHSFGGAGCARVDVSLDGGKTWTEANLEKPAELRAKERVGKVWGWCQFSKRVPLSAAHKEQLRLGRRVELELVSKALNHHWDAQPERSAPYYNARGVCINHMYRVPVVVDPNEMRAKRDHKELQTQRNTYYKPTPTETPTTRTGQEFPNKPSGGTFHDPWVHDMR
jgi:sulfite oxidase